MHPATAACLGRKLPAEFLTASHSAEAVYSSTLICASGAFSDPDTHFIKHELVEDC